jgi:hypothetical protein
VSFGPSDDLAWVFVLWKINVPRHALPAGVHAGVCQNPAIAAVAELRAAAFIKDVLAEDVPSQ